jgi:hypothetical protein
MDVAIVEAYFIYPFQIPRAVIEPVLFLAIIFRMVDFARGDLNMFILLTGPVVIISNSATAYGN